MNNEKNWLLIVLNTTTTNTPIVYFLIVNYPVAVIEKFTTLKYKEYVLLF